LTFYTYDLRFVPKSYLSHTCSGVQFGDCKSDFGREIQQFFPSHSYRSLRPALFDTPYGDDEFKELQHKISQFPLTWRRDNSGKLYLYNPVKVGGSFLRRGTAAHLKAIEDKRKQLIAASAGDHLRPFYDLGIRRLHWQTCLIGKHLMSMPRVATTCATPLVVTAWTRAISVTTEGGSSADSCISFRDCRSPRRCAKVRAAVGIPWLKLKWMAPVMPLQARLKGARKTLQSGTAQYIGRLCSQVRNLGGEF